jgi:histone H3/H4
MDEPEAKESVVIGSKIKAYVKEKGLMCSGELPDAVSDAVRQLLDKACDRTKENKRSTVRPCDL